MDEGRDPESVAGAAANPQAFEDSPEQLRRRITELASLYEVARSLIGARDRRQLGARVVLSMMGALGVRSGALFAIDERGRYQLVYRDSDAGSEPRALVVTGRGREWMLRQGAFELRAPAARAALGDLRDRLAREHDAAFGVAIPDRQGLAGFLVFGPRLIPGGSDAQALALLDSVGALTAQALDVHRPREPRPRATRPARSMKTLRDEHPAFAAMIGASPALLETCQSLLSAAGARFPVLLTGETGVGKELAARALHDLSDRASGPFEVVDCGSIPRELIESEIFGHVRGAFTGAHRDRRGAFEIAHRGTLFLDEIGEMPLQLQTRLLRVIQEGRIRKVGDERAIDVDVRVVAATNRDLQAEVAARRFREDLYYRLNVFVVRIPPLRERTADLEPLVRHFLALERRGRGAPSWQLDPVALGALASYAWPGNVRELSNFCAALGVRARDHDTIGLEQLDQVWRSQHGGNPPPWSGRPSDRRGGLGGWVLEQARSARFNLLEAESVLKRRSREGTRAPLTERSALGYYLTGEILRALVEAQGDAVATSAAIAGDELLVRRVAPRVAKVCEALSAARGEADLRRKFAKLPAGYEEALRGAHRLLARRSS